MTAVVPIRLPMTAPDDLGEFEALLDSGEVVPAEIVALWCKTRGNGLLNDFTKPWVDLLLRRALASRMEISEEEVAARTPILVSGGAEGCVSPHLVVWMRGVPSNWGLLAAVERRSIGPDDQGTVRHAHATAHMVLAALDRLGIEPADVGLVFVRAPTQPGRDASSRIAAAQGAALALGEISSIALDNPEVFAHRAFAVARHDGPHQQVMVLANGPGGDRRFAIAHGQLADPIDAAGAARVLERLGAPALPQVADPKRIIAAISKGDAPRGDLLRGLPHAMRLDNDIAMHRHARAAYGGMLSALIGHSAVLVSGGAEAQGPPDGGFVSIVARVEDGEP